MKRRVFHFSALLAILCVLITSILVTMSAHRSFESSMRHEVAAEGTYLCAGIEQYGGDYLNRLELRRGHRITLIAPDGSVLFDSNDNPQTMENHADRPEVIAALQNGTGDASRVSATLREQTYYYAIRMQDGSVFRLATATDSPLAAYNNLFWMVALIVVCLCLLTALVSSRITRRIVSPLNNIDLDAPEDSPAYEELAPLLTKLKKQRKQILLQAQELDRQHAHFAAITENMNEGLLVLDQDGLVLSYNKSALRLLASQAILPIGLHISTLNRSQQFREAIASATEGQSVAHVIEICGRVCQLFVSPITAEPSLLGIIVILMDITERQEREKLRREFTANVSHELKTPLTAISGYAEIMMNGVAKPEDVPEFSHSIYQESQRLIALVRDLMFLSHLEEGAAPPMQRVNLLRLAESVLDSLSPKAGSFSVRLSVSGEPIELYAISTVLQEMLYNLLDNAIKYNRPGGCASIRVQAEAQEVLLSVSDTGIGIPKAEQSRIFERFYRVDKSHNKAIEGTGLGLAIVKHAAALHNARIELSSSEEGTTFTLRFPQHEADSLAP